MRNWVVLLNNISKSFASFCECKVFYLVDKKVSGAAMRGNTRVLTLQAAGGLGRLH